MIKCTKCDKEAAYVIDGQSVCKKHGDKEEEQGTSMANRMVGRLWGE